MPLIIRSLEEYKQVIAETKAETEQLKAKFPDIKTYDYILDQLKYIEKVLLIEKRRPTFDEVESIDMGAIAIKNFDDEMPAYAEKIKKIAYVFRNTEDVHYLDNKLK